MARQRTKVALWVTGVTGSVMSLGACLLFLACAGLIVVVEFPITLAFGWVRYLQRVVPKSNPDPWSVVSGLVCLAGATVGTHLLLRWLYAASDARPEARSWPVKRSLRLVGLLIVMFVAGTAVAGLVQQTGWLIRSKKPLAELNTPNEYGSRYHLERMGTVGQSYVANGGLLQSQFDASGRAMHSWQTALLPHMNSSDREIYHRIDHSKPWNHPANAAPMAENVYEFQYLAFSESKVNGFGVSHYAGNVHVVMGDAKTLNSFPAGASNTILAGEVSSSFRAWGDPLNARDPRLGGNGHPEGFGGARGKLAQFVMLDGSVRTFDPKQLADAGEAK